MRSREWNREHAEKERQKAYIVSRLGALEGNASASQRGAVKVDQTRASMADWCEFLQTKS